MFKSDIERYDKKRNKANNCKKSSNNKGIQQKKKRGKNNCKADKKQLTKCQL